MHAFARVMLLGTFLWTGTAWAAEGADPVKIVLDRIHAAHQQNYDALERAPIRRWGELNQLRPLTDLRHDLANPRVSAEDRTLPHEWADERFNAIYAKYLGQSGLRPGALARRICGIRTRRHPTSLRIRTC
jgi:hypothetical protein